MPPSHPTAPTGVSRRRTTRVTAVLASALLLLSTVLVTEAAATHRRVAATISAANTFAAPTLRCVLRTSPSMPVSFSPAVSATPRHITARGTIRLDDCGGEQSGIRSGRLALQVSGHAACTRVSDVRGSATITWYSDPDGHGRVMGRSTLVPAATGAQGYSSLDSFLSGRIHSGTFAGHGVTARALPTTDVRSCFGRGLDSVGLRGNVSIS
ncbi:hypothetical protein ABZ734_01970 [Streptomyces sp. NPDC006660]|uniref:hypothetical protein n=1 Tax=Streptomyces sp. NPDC006660 TaxID=3156901 RepID=UPI0033C8ADEE